MEDERVSRAIYNEIDLYFDESMSSSDDYRMRSGDLDVRVRKEDKRWNLRTYHSRREIGVGFPGEDIWIKTTLALSTRGREFVDRVPTRYHYEMKPDIFTGEPWSVYVDANRHNRRRFKFKLPRDNDGYTMWVRKR